MRAFYINGGFHLSVSVPFAFSIIQTMQISILGIFILLASFLICLGLRKSFKKLYGGILFFCLFGSLIFDAGYLARVGSFEIEFNYYFSVLLFLFSLPEIYIERKRINKRMALVPLSFFLIAVIGAACSFLFHYSFQSVSFAQSWDPFFDNQDLVLPFVSFSLRQFSMMILRFFLYFVNILSLSLYLSLDRLISLSKKMEVASFILLFFLFIEFIIENCVSPSLFRVILIRFIGASSSTVVVPRVFLKMYCPLGFWREPSNAAFGFFVFLLNELFLCFKKGNKKSFFLGLSFVGLLALSGSLSSLIYIFVFSLVLAIAIRKPKIVWPVWSTSVVMAGTLGFLFYKTRIVNLFDNFSKFSLLPSSLPQTSQIIRLYSIYNNLLVFFRHPFLGCGLGTLYCYSGLVTALANIGILGVLAWILSLYYFWSYFGKRSRIFSISIFVFSIAFVFTGHMGYFMYFEYSFYCIILISGCLGCFSQEPDGLRCWFSSKGTRLFSAKKQSVDK